MHFPYALLLILTGDSLGPSELVVDKKEVKYKSTQYEQHTVEIFPGRLTDDWGQNQENRYENHKDRDEDRHLQAEQNISMWA